MAGTFFFFLRGADEGILVDNRHAVSSPKFPTSICWKSYIHQIFWSIIQMSPIFNQFSTVHFAQVKYPTNFQLLILSKSNVQPIFNIRNNTPSKHDINGPFVVSVKATNGSMASHFLSQMARFSVAICLPCHEPAVNGPLKASHFTAI